jgi:hypothetical protein
MRHLAKVAAVLFLPIILAASAGTLDGTFALQTGGAKSHGYLRATATADPLDEHLDIWMTPENGTRAILRYTVDMTKLLHVICVSDDFVHFLHIHPVLGSDGHFTIDQRFPAAGPYHIYADGEPQGLGQQVFRFDLPVASGAASSTRTLPPAARIASAGPYAVELSTTSVLAGRDSAVIVHIRKSGKPARDLHPYLGALAHAVLLDTKDLSYVHVHPMPLAAERAGSMAGMDMSSMSGMGGMDMTLPDSATSSPAMELHLHLREAGAYKLWLQFRGGASLYVAPFAVTAR